jgi:hypothetical protein
LTRTSSVGSKPGGRQRSSAQHDDEKFSSIFKRLGRNPAPPSRVILLKKEEERTCEPCCDIGPNRHHRSRNGGSSRRRLVRSPSPLLQLLRWWRNLERLPARLDRSGRYVSPIRDLLVLGGAGIDRYGEAAHCGGLFFWPQIQVCNQFMYGENFSRTVELIMPARVEPRPLRDIL